VPASCLVVEDAVAGAEAARAAGMDCLGIGSAFDGRPGLTVATAATPAGVSVTVSDMGVRVL
jgi:mannitol-1-/sugar-/sorbitol-6-phosphatase